MRHWQALRDKDARKAFNAMRRLAADPKAALKLAGEHLEPAKPIDPQWLKARLRDLDHEEFAERERATRELEAVGDGVALALKRFLAANPSAEASRRADQILARIRGRGPNDQARQTLRALEVLEWIGTAKAKELTEKLAKGPEGMSSTEDAKRSLNRWKGSAK